MSFFKKHGKKIRNVAITVAILAAVNHFIGNCDKIFKKNLELSKDPIVLGVYDSAKTINASLIEIEKVLAKDRLTNKDINTAEREINRIKRILPDSLVNEKHLNYLVSKGLIAIKDKPSVKLIIARVNGYEEELNERKVEAQ